MQECIGDEDVALFQNAIAARGQRQEGISVRNIHVREISKLDKYEMTTDLTMWLVCQENIILKGEKFVVSFSQKKAADVLYLFTLNVCRPVDKKE